MNPEDLPEYTQPFTHLFNKKKFKKLPEKGEWDHEINLMKEAPKELNTKAYTMTIKKEEALNQWLDKQLKAGLIVESKSLSLIGEVINKLKKVKYFNKLDLFQEYNNM